MSVLARNESISERAFWFLEAYSQWSIGFDYINSKKKKKNYVITDHDKLWREGADQNYEITFATNEGKNKEAHTYSYIKLFFRVFLSLQLLHYVEWA